MSCATSSTASRRRTTTTVTNPATTTTASSSSSSSPSSKGSSMSPRLFSTASTSAASAASAQDVTAHANPHGPAHARSQSQAQASSSSSSHPHSHSHIQPSLPSAETERHIAQARAAVVASIGNLLDSELQSRAQMLHDNAGALDKQEKDVMRATEGLRGATGKLAKEADAAARKLKEVGNVQNWAEVLERGFLVLEETVRLANGGAESEEGSSTCSCDCSQCGGSSDGDDDDDDDDAQTMAVEGEEEGAADESERQGRLRGGLQRMSLDADMHIDAMGNDAEASDARRATESETASVAASVSTR